MRKYIILSMFIIFVSYLYSERVYLLPSRNGEPSEIVPIKSNRNVKTKIRRKELLRDSLISNYNKGVTQWLVNTDGGTPDYYLSGVNDVDTFLVWFAPAARCSVHAYEVTNIAITDPTQQAFTMFFATLDQSIDYASEFPEYHSNPPPSSHRGFATVFQSLDTFAWGADSIWTVTQDTLLVPIDNGTDYFAVGWVKTRGDSCPQPNIYANGSSPYHTLMYRDRGNGYGWYSSYHAVKVRALVNFYIPPLPRVWPEDLPDSYIKDERTVNILVEDYSIPSDSAGAKDMVIQYMINGGSSNEKTCSLYYENPDESIWYWMGNLPGMFPDDTIEYQVIATFHKGYIETTQIYSYIIREGTPGNFLFVDNGYTESDILPDYWIDTCDVWDYYGYGPLDSSVYAFYNTVVIRDWGSTYLGDGLDYGARILYSESTWVKQLLDRGGNFWLSDQDQGYGFGICPDYGVYDVPENHWVQKYLGIQGMYDDHPLIGGDAVIAYGNSSDTIIGDLFNGIGFQNPDEIYIAPYYYITGNFAYSYTGSFDSLQSGAVVNMRDTTNDLVISYRYTGPSENYKVYNDFFPWDYIAKPGVPDTLDLVAIDSLVEDVLGWFGYTSGVSDRTIEPEKVVKLLPVGIVTKDAMIRFYLPKEMLISLSIYDKTGRLIKNLKKGKAKAGLNSVRWNGKDSYGNPISSGIYFCQLRTGNKTITDKFIVIR